MLKSLRELRDILGSSSNKVKGQQEASAMICWSSFCAASDPYHGSPCTKMAKNSKIQDENDHRSSRMIIGHLRII